MSQLQRLCLAALAVVFALVVIGGTVRSTNSGLGCTEWPRCNGSFIPAWEIHTLIEYTHRLTGTVAGLVVLAVAVVAWRSYRRVPAIVYPATGTLVLVILQGALGGATVLTELPPELITIHLGVAMTILALLLVTTTAAFATDRPLARPPVAPGFARLAAISAIALLGLMLVGAYVAGAGYTLACNGWPLCNGQVVPDAGLASVWIHFLHRVIALVTGVLIAALAYAALPERARAPQAALLAFAALGAFVIQVLVGAANIWTQASAVAQIAHLGVGTFLWLDLAFLNVRVFALHALLPAFQAGTAPGSGLAGAVR